MTCNMWMTHVNASPCGPSGGPSAESLCDMLGNVILNGASPVFLLLSYSAHTVASWGCAPHRGLEGKLKWIRSWQSVPHVGRPSLDGNTAFPSTFSLRRASTAPAESIFYAPNATGPTSGARIGKDRGVRSANNTGGRPSGTRFLPVWPSFYALDTLNGAVAVEHVIPGDVGLFEMGRNRTRNPLRVLRNRFPRTPVWVRIWLWWRQMARGVGRHLRIRWPHTCGRGWWI